MMKFQHRFRVDAPLSEVLEFHSLSSSMGAITPPPIVARIHRAPAVLGEGDEMEFTLWVGPLPVRWLAHIEQVSGEGFTDRQLRGPFTTRAIASMPEQPWQRAFIQALHKRLLVEYVEAIWRRTDQVTSSWPDGGRRDMLVEMRKH